MEPNYERAANMALKTLIDNDIHKAPISPFHVLKNQPGVMMISFEEMSDTLNKNRRDVITSCKSSPDAVTAVNVDGDDISYIIAYNQYLSVNILQKAFARELGHVVLGHDGTLPDDVRTAEARCFSQHFLFPRPLIHLLTASGLKLTTHVLGSITACNEECVVCMRKLPVIHTDPELNRKVRDQFLKYTMNYLEYKRLIPNDMTAVVDLGQYMKGYEE